ncbi:MAG: PAS domain S-box protein [Vicinamibacterales bacterium]
MRRARSTPLLEPGSPFRTLAEHVPVMLWVSDPNGDAVLLNPDWRHFRGLSTDDAVPAGWGYGIHSADRRAVLAAFRRAHRQAAPYVAEYRVNRADGQLRWLHDHGMPLFDSTGTFVGQMGCCVDITAQRAPGDLRPDERRLTQLVETSRDIVYRIRVTPSLAVEYVGGAVEAISGRTPEEWYADPMLIVQAIHPDDRHAAALTTDRVARVPASTTFRWLHRDGRITWAEHFRVPIFDPAGHIVGFEGIARDITHRVETEQRLRESEEQLRELAARVQAAREEERAEVARELHDELGQTLTALKLEINRAVGVFGSGSTNVDTVNRLQSIVGLVDLGIGMVKRISARLRPATLDHLGLPEAVRWEADTFRARTGIRCQVRANRTATRLDPGQQTALFRIVQEALNNVVCHANASAVQVTITENDSKVELRVKDNGRGITTAQAAAPTSLGLLGMKERAGRIGGSFAVSGQRGKGTLVSVTVPLGTPGPTSTPDARRGRKATSR